jgi:peptidoglycan/LPS O-acetylase OafA/YrhL
LGGGVISVRGKLDGLTSARFFFAMMVVVFHFTGQLPAEFQTLPAFVSNMGPLAVSWFFVLSGFIIAYNYPELSTNKQRRDFCILRVARLWPVHCVVLKAAVSFLYVTKNGYLLRHEDWLFYHYTLTQTWTMNADIATGYNGPSWSVSNERLSASHAKRNRRDSEMSVVFDNGRVLQIDQTVITSFWNRAAGHG